MRYLCAFLFCISTGFLSKGEEISATPGNPSESTLPLPPHTAILVDNIRHIATDETLDFKKLWEKHSNNSDLRSLLLERWLSSDPISAIKASYDTDLEDFSWKQWGKIDPKAAYEYALKIDRRKAYLPLISWAEKEPGVVEEIVEKTQTELDLYEYQARPEIRIAISRGIAKTDWIKALEHSGLDRPFWQVISEWSEENAQEAFDWIYAHRYRSIECLEEVSEALTKVNRPHIVEVLGRTQTGIAKNAILKGLSNADSNKPHYCRSYDNPRIRPKPDSQSFLSLLDQACQIGSEQFSEALRDNSRDHLPLHQQRLIRSVIGQRSSHHQPWNGASSDAWFGMSSKALIRWLEIDKEAALKHLDSLDRRSRQDDALRDFVEAIGKTDMAEAFWLFHKYPEYTDLTDQQSTVSIYESERYTWETIFKNLAGHDRENFLKYAPMKGAWKMHSLAGYASAWIEKDFGGVIEELLERNVGPECLERLEPSRPIFLENFKLVPREWLPFLIKNHLLTKGAHVSWLATPPPSDIDPETLKQIRTDRIWCRLRFHQRDHEIVGDLIRNGTYLDSDLRSHLAVSVVGGFVNDWDAANEWIKTIPEQFRSKAQKHVDYRLKRREERIQEERLKQLKGPHLLLSALNMTPGQLDLKNSDYWPPSHWKKILNAIESLSSQVANQILEQEQHSELPTPHKAALIARASLTWSKTIRGSSKIPLQATKVAHAWGKTEPVATAQWAEKLPPGIIRENALLMVAHEWKKFDREEMKTWARTLSDEEREMLGVR